ncbi:formate dehydrogenase accessory sulfurtransferase FdhD [Duganella sp. BJB1802]|uniref:formate dehydrogenase accessory sulfurtransferase FdhD n=1 Tax=Duganella sp. BJB1802 TaxID=2744575 RepID=UPI0015948FF7|nr:formate dehydrogenase accessory sulfurtransferase FdhD [Duganella sp. BJB1802]NVD71034.1 formate dehydrogenase accessory sulfurtransferase FdhD [Duganella sp. BJB1802]
MKFETETERSGLQERSVLRRRGTAPQDAARGTDRVAEEMPVALVFNGISHAVMMVTPRELEAFALGFALTEGLVGKAADVFDIELREHARSFEVALTIAQEEFMQLKQQRRSMAGRSGCGVCGVESLEQLDLRPAPIGAAALHDADTLPPAIARAAAELGKHQELMQATGGVHAAAWCDAAGAVLRVCEDVGRHNALDKLIGHLARDGVDMRRGFVFMSSRASYELVRKAARMHIPMLATISAPSTLAIDVAVEAGVKLVSFCRQDGCVEYT